MAELVFVAELLTAVSQDKEPLPTNWTRGRFTGLGDADLSRKGSGTAGPRGDAMGFDDGAAKGAGV